MKKLVFLLSAAYDSHYLKKVYACKNNGYDVDVYGFQRDFNLANRIVDEVVVLGYVQNKNYIKRIGTVYKSINNVIDLYDDNAVFYATTFDIAMVCMVRNVRYIYGISDIVHSSFPKYLRSIFIWLDQKIIRSSCFTVLTSPAFVDYLRLDSDNKKKCIYLLNKLDISFKNRPRPLIKRYNGSIVIGYVGNIRYPNSILRLSEIVGLKYPNIKFLYFGNGNKQILDIVNNQCRQFANVEYMGPFRNPEDLDSIYAQIDIVACNYDTTTINERLLEPNKLYESLFYSKPIIVAKNTYLAERVIDIGCGIITDNSEQDIIRILSSIDENVINNKSAAARKVETTDLIESYDMFFKRLDKVLR